MDAISKLEELSKLNNIKLISLGSKGALSKAWYLVNDDMVLVKVIRCIRGICFYFS